MARVPKMQKYNNSTNQNVHGFIQDFTPQTIEQQEMNDGYPNVSKPVGGKVSAISPPDGNPRDRNGR